MFCRNERRIMWKSQHCLHFVTVLRFFCKDVSIVKNDTRDMAIESPDAPLLQIFVDGKVGRKNAVSIFAGK